MSALDIRNLDVFYGRTQITHGVNLEVNEGESYALVGESGSGKSTVLKAVVGLAPEWKGAISVFGQPRGQFGAFVSAGAIPVISALLGIKVGAELSVIIDRFRS